MSWNPAPILNTANWQGGTLLATKQQLISSISSVNNTLSSLEFQISTIGAAATVSTVAEWAKFPAYQDVNMVNHNIYSTGVIGVSTITATSTITCPLITATTVSATTVNATTVNATVNGTLTGAVNATSLNVTGATNFNGNSIKQFAGGTTSTIGINLGSYYGIQENASTFVNLLVDRGADVTGSASIDLTAQYGGGSRINLHAASASVLAVTPTSQVNITADGNTTIAPTYVPVGGAVNITANAGSGTGTPVVGYGQIYLTANSFNTTTQPGFIAHSAGANAIYSGTFSPFGGLGQAYGNNYIWGQAGNSFVCSPTTPTFPAVIGSNYFYAYLGAALGPSGQIAGNRFRGGIAAEFIQPFPLYGDLYIQGDNAGNMIQISSVKVLNMSTTGAITGVGNINLSSINGGPYVSTIPSSLSFTSLDVSSLTASTLGAATATISSLTVSTIIGVPLISTFSTATISSLTAGNTTTNALNVNYTFINPSRTAPEAGIVISTMFNQNFSSIISTANLSSYSNALQLITSGTNMFITAGSIPTPTSPIYLTGANTPYTATTEASGTWFAPQNPSWNSVWSLYVTRTSSAKNFNLYTINTNDQIWITFPNTVSFTFTGSPPLGTTYMGTTFQLAQNQACNVSWNLGTNVVTVNQLVTSEVEYSTVTNAITNFETDVYETVLTTKNTWTAGGVSTIYPGNLALTYSTIAIGGATARTNTYPIEIGASTRIAGQIVAQTGSISTLNVSSLYVGLITGSTIIDTVLSTTAGEFDSLKTSSLTATTGSISTLIASTFTTGATTLTAPIGVYDFTKTLTLTSTTYNSVSSLYQSLVNYKYNLNLTTEVTNSIPYPPGGDSGSLSWSGLGTWASTITTIQQGTNNAIHFGLPSNLQSGYPATATVDFYNSGQSAGLTLGFTGAYTLVTVPYGSTYRLTWAAGTGTYGTWSYSTSAPPYGTANDTTFQINQNIYNTNISTSDALTLTGTSIYINGPLQANNATIANLTITDSMSLPSTILLSTITATTISGGNATLSSLTVGGPIHVTTGGGNLYIDDPACFVSSNSIYASTIGATNLNSKNISSVANFNSYNTRAIQNPGNILVYNSGNLSFGNGTTVKDINLTGFVPGVYTCQAFCYGNAFRCLEATLYYYTSTQYQMYNSNGFDNYNGVLWTTATVNLYPTARFQNQTDGPGDTFVLCIFMISGKITAVGNDPPFPEPSTLTISTATTNTGTPTPIVIGLSTLIGSTIGMVAKLNTYILSGSVSTPTFISSGNLYLQAQQDFGAYGTNVITGAAANTTILSGASTILQGVYPSGVIALDSGAVNITASTVSIQNTPFDNVQGAIITSTPTYYVSNTSITSTSLVFLTPASPINLPYWVTYNQASSFCINVSSLATPTVMNYWIASYSGYGQQLTTSIVASGGTVITASGRKFHTFTSSGSFSLSSNPAGATIEIMIIGGGGGGGAQSGGGGGAGNMLIVQIALTPASYSVSIGPGGVGGIIGTSSASNGADTTFGTFMTAPGGGGGGTYSISNGLNGGCGGGGAEYTQLGAGSGTAGTVTSGTTISNLYNNGGAGYYSGSMGGAGGGGTHTAGGTQTGINSVGAPGGDGTLYYGTTFGGGGGGQGGGTYNPPYSDTGGSGGSGGGGAGASSTANGTNGSGYGSGGGGGQQGGAGSSGICIVSYVYP